MEHILVQLKENLQLIYRKAVDADSRLNELHSQGHGKFQEVFSQDSVFTVKSKRFGPYVDEVAKDIMSLEGKDIEPMQEALPSIIKKMELLLSTLAQFKGAMKSK